MPLDSIEIGAYWEIPQPMVQKARLKWRGRYSWDWHAEISFSMGYTPDERERLADVYMSDYKNIFGHYPKSVVSGFIDAHTLNHLYEKYNIVACANCKDQYRTDGYTLWSWYWNQVYYPSKLHITWHLQSFDGCLFMDIDVEYVEIKVAGDESLEWFLDLTAPKTGVLPFIDIQARITLENNSNKFNLSEREEFCISS